MEKNNGLEMVEIDSSTLACAVSHLSTLLNGVFNDCCGETVAGVMNGVSREEVGYKKEAENSREWIIEHYDTVAGAIGVASVITEMLSTVCINYNITINKP